MSARLSCLLLVLLLRGAAAPAPVPLGGAGDFVILAKTAITEVGGGIITGNIGLSPNAALAITGFALTADGSNQFATSAQVSGLVYASDYAVPTPAMLTAAVSAMEAAYTDAAGRPLSHVSNAENFDGILGGKIFTAGVYKWSTDVSFALDIILSGSVDDVFIFQIAGNLLAGSAVKVLLVADGSGHGTPWASNIIWQVAGYASLGTAAHLEGVLLVKTHCAVNAGSSINGRVLAQTAVTLETSAIITQSTSIGLHAPVLNGAAFAPTGSQLILTFDSQPTDRGGMAGVGQCALVLAAATVTTIRGGGTDEPLCYWRDDSTLVVYLNFETTLKPGSTVTLLPDAIRPAISTSQCPSPICAQGSATIDIDFPCGLGVKCAQPVAVVSGSQQISACPDELLALDGSASSGGGIKPLIYAWRADSTRSDFADELNARLQLLDGEDAVSIALGDLPYGAAQFVLLLEVKSFLGEFSGLVSFVVTRAGGVQPSLSIDGPRIATTLSRTQLLGVASLAACWQASKGVQIDFEWTLGNVTLSATGEPAPSAVRNSLVLPSPLLSSLLLPPFSLLPGYTYHLSLRAQMAADPSVFSDAQVSLDVRVQPLQLLVRGGDRRLSVDESFSVDALESYDPNVRRFDVVTGELLEDANLLFSWSVRAVANSTVAEALVNATGSVLQLPASSLPPGSYAIALTISKPSSGLAAASETLYVELVEGSVPAVVFQALAALKFNPTWSTNSDRVALTTSLDVASLALQAAGLVAFAYEWKAFVRIAGADMLADLDLGDTNAVTTTGLGGPNLAFRSGALTAGVLYRFALTVTGSSQPAFGAVMVQMNRAPWGGGLSISPTSGFALVTAFELRASGWTDDVDDLPLRYGFEFARDLVTRVVTLADLQFLPALGVTLAEGESGFAFVRVLDAYGAETLVRTPLVVGPPPVLSCDDMVQLLEEAELAVLLGASSSAKRRLQMLADSFGRQLAACDANGDGQIDVGFTRRVLKATNASLDSVGYAANSSLSFINRMLAASATASATAVTTETSRRQSAGTLDTILQDPDLQDGAAQAEGSAQLAAIAQEAVVDGGADQVTFDALMSALGSVLVANVSRATAVQYDATNAAAIAAAESLARAYVVGALPGEQIRKALNAAVNISAARVPAASLANSTRATPDGFGSVTLPLSIIDGQDGAIVDGGVDVLMYAFARNVHGGGGGGAAEAELHTGVLTVVLASGGTALPISGLVEPILLAIPLTTPAAVDGSNCTWPQNAVNGSDCTAVSQNATCHYWDTAVQAYLTDGCKTISSFGGDSSLLLCACTHLTDFAGLVEVPTSKEELEVDVVSVQFNTFSVAQAKAALTDPTPRVITENITIFSLVLSISGMCALSVGMLLFLDGKHRYNYRIEAKRQVDDEHSVGPVRAAIVAQLKLNGREAVEARVASKQLCVKQATLHAIVIQRYVRGRQARAVMQKLLKPDATVPLGKDRRAPHARPTLRGLIEMARHKLRKEHSVIGVWFTDPVEQGRAELAQRFWLVVIVGIVIQLLLFQPSTGSSDDSWAAEAGFNSVNVVQVVVNAVITSVLVIPMILLTQIIFHFGYARSSPLSERLATRLLGGTEALADSVLVQAARPEQRARMLEMRGPVRHASKMAAVFGARGRKYAFGANDLEIGGAASASAAEAPRLQKPPPLAVDSAPASASSAPASASPIAAPQTLGLAQLRVRMGFTLTPPARAPPPRISAPLDGAIHNLTVDVVRQLRAKFARYDSNNSGVVSTAELGVLLRDLGFTLSRHRLAALELELQDRDGSDGREAGITLNGLVYWYDGIVTQAVERELARHSGWRKYMPRLPSIPPIVRIVLAWLLVWAIFVALALVAVVYARVFGPATTQLILFSWCLGEFQSIAVQEPLLIILAALLPVLLVQSKFLSRCMETIAQSEENLSAFFVKNIKGLSGRLFSRCAGGGGRPFHAS